MNKIKVTLVKWKFVIMCQFGAEGYFEMPTLLLLRKIQTVPFSLSDFM